MDQQTHYLTWMKNKYITNSHFQTSMSHVFNNSWDDQTFVDDVAFIWPPRSYTCSFCKRKFRSAQALGGHMNVHRRDRAKLKLSPTSQNIEALTSNPNPTSEPSFFSLSSPPCDVLDQNIGLGKNVRSREDSRLGGDDGAVNLTIGLNLVISNHNEGINLKRHKSNVLPVPLFLGSCSKDLDLELRLGDSPKRK